MKRFLLLARFLRKCGKGEKESASAQANLKGDNNVLIAVLGMLLLPVGLFFLGKLAGPLADLLGSLEPLMSVFLLIAALLTLVLSVMELMNSLFLTSDLANLLSLPFSARQIVLARTLNTLLTKLALITLIIIPFGVGFSFGYSGALPSGFWLGLVLGDVLIPVVCVLLAATLVVLVMTVFRIARNREMMAVIAALLFFALWVTRMLLKKDSSSLNSENVMQAMTKVVGLLDGPSAAIPVIPFIVRVMGGVSLLPNLLAALGITLAALALYLVVSGTLYLKSALRMLDGTGKKRRMNETVWDKGCRRHSALWAYTRKDLRCIFRNPAYLVNGWLMMLAWPVVVASLFWVRSGMPFSLPGQEQEGAEMMRRLYMMSGSFGIALFSACSTVGLSCLAGTVISREGRSFFFMKFIPVSYKTQVLGKRNAVLLISGAGSIGYEFIAGVVLLIMGIVPVECVVFCILLTAPLVLILANAMVRHDMKKPNLDWDSEAVLAKSNAIGAVIWVIGMIVAVILFLLAPVLLIAFSLDNALDYALLIALGLVLLAGLGAFLSERAMGRSAEEYLSDLEA